MPSPENEIRRAVREVVRKLADGDPERAMRVLLTDKVGTTWTDFDAALMWGYMVEMLTREWANQKILEKLYARSMGILLDDDDRAA